MQVKVMTVTKARLDTIPENERAFYLHMGHLRNEVMVLHKTLWWIQNNPNEDPICQSINVSQTFIFLRLLAGKVWEGWDLVQVAYFKGQVSKSIGDQLSAETTEALAALRTYFGRGNIIRKIRNEFAFHYSAQNIREQLREVEESDDLKIYWTGKSINTFYQFSEIVANSAMLNAVKREDYDTAVRRLMKEVLDVANMFISFCDGCMEYMVTKYFAEKKKYLDWEEVALEGVPRRDEITLPFFIRDVERAK